MSDKVKFNPTYGFSVIKPEIVSKAEYKEVKLSLFQKIWYAIELPLLAGATYVCFFTSLILLAGG